MIEESNVKSRDLAGKRSGAIGIFVNLILVMIKAAAGVLSNSVAITADALNNLADCASSFVAYLGFSLSAREKDKRHPYGHGRMEYICGFVVSLLVLFTGISVLIDAVKRIRGPQPMTVTALTAAALGIGILAKICMAWYVKRLNRKIASSVLKAIGIDNAADAFVTAITLAGILAAPYTDLPVDGFLGIVVSAAILKSGAGSFADNLVQLLGEGADPATEEEIMQIVTEYIPARSVEEISMHDYGQENRLVYIKLDYSQTEENRCGTQTLSCIKQKIKQELQMDATLYWDLSEALNG